MAAIYLAIIFLMDVFLTARCTDKTMLMSPRGSDQAQFGFVPKALFVLLHRAPTSSDPFWERQTPQLDEPQGSLIFTSFLALFKHCSL